MISVEMLTPRAFALATYMLTDPTYAETGRSLSDLAKMLRPIPHAYESSDRRMIEDTLHELTELNIADCALFRAARTWWAGVHFLSGYGVIGQGLVVEAYCFNLNPMCCRNAADRHALLEEIAQRWTTAQQTEVSNA